MPSELFRQRRLQLADLIEAQPHTEYDSPAGFYMGMWQHECGTPSCIAGWAAQAYCDEMGEPFPADGKVFEVRDLAVKWLGIEDNRISVRRTMYRLFEPDLAGGLDKVTPQQAASTLRHFAETDEVVWDLTQ